MLAAFSFVESERLFAILRRRAKPSYLDLGAMAITDVACGMRDTFARPATCIVAVLASAESEGLSAVAQSMLRFTLAPWRSPVQYSGCVQKIPVPVLLLEVQLNQSDGYRSTSTQRCAMH